MRDYGKMFLGLILAGIVLMFIGLWLVSIHTRSNAANQAMPHRALPQVGELRGVAPLTPS